MISAYLSLHLVPVDVMFFSSNKHDTNRDNKTANAVLNTLVTMTI